MAYKKSDKGKLLLFLFVLLGIVIGSFIGNVASDIESLHWMNVGYRFGITEPFTLDLKVIYMQLKLLFNINISSILGIILGILIYRRI